ncbi:hypothetical protein PT974_07250 [Cladobotryum mycophilum]|uniref:Extracellular membrane protein CFEM domain-containing protein n=1 Tax=Cladobotryum mycophilum TaxID=491253 RepID=A0ABR0SNZ7_9HYPO
MQFFKFFLFAIAASPTVNACKCISKAVPGEHDAIATFDCCGKRGGTFVDNDCAAHSISGKLKEFSHCCNDHDDTSDCKH